MEYVDPHHKRTDFTATSYRKEDGAGGKRIVLSGHGLHASVVLRESGESIATIVPEFKEEFVLWKIQILERQKWLTLDFRAYPTLTRILVHIDELNRSSLEEDIRDLVGGRNLLFHCYHNQQADPAGTDNDRAAPGRV
jgi:hypothetical protein